MEVIFSSNYASNQIRDWLSACALTALFALTTVGLVITVMSVRLLSFVSTSCSNTGSFVYYSCIVSLY